MVPIREFDAVAEYRALSPEAQCTYQAMVMQLANRIRTLGLPDPELRLQLLRRTLSQVLNPERYCG